MDPCDEIMTGEEFFRRRIRELETENARLRDEVKDLRAACEQKQEILNYHPADGFGIPHNYSERSKE